jgi:hypothetical protein
MPHCQLDLFSGAGFRLDNSFAITPDRPQLAPAALTDDELVARIPFAALADCHDLASEAGRRNLIRAVPALEALCRRFKGFGAEHAIPEQAAALTGLTAVGGREAANAVARILADHVVQGPGLREAAGAAARIGARVPRDVLVVLLRHAMPEVRASACRCARPWPEVIALTIELLSDLNSGVAVAAACALGRMGRIEGLPVITRLLREQPSIEAIEAVAAVALEECIVLLGRIARTRPDLATAALAVLEGLDDPRAATLLAALERSVTEGDCAAT